MANMKSLYEENYECFRCLIKITSATIAVGIISCVVIVFSIVFDALHLKTNPAGVFDITESIMAFIFSLLLIYGAIKRMRSLLIPYFTVILGGIVELFVYFVGAIIGLTTGSSFADSKIDDMFEINNGTMSSTSLTNRTDTQNDKTTNYVVVLVVSVLGILLCVWALYIVARCYLHFNYSKKNKNIA